MIEGFLQPRSLDEALHLRRLNPESFWYGGGTWLNYKDSPSGQAISLEFLNLDLISIDKKFLTIGSMVSIQNLIDSEIVLSVLKEAASGISSRNIRNIATLGGNIGAAAQDSVFIPILVALDAELETAEHGSLSLESYIQENLSDLILSVRIPLQKQIAKVCRTSRTSSSSSLVNTATVLNFEDGSTSLKSVRVVLNGIDGCLTRLGEIENALMKGVLSDKDQIQNEVSGYLKPIDDYRCSSEYKVYIASVSIADSLTESLESLL
jgi:putative selenate reductase FAD-binding subunit